MIVDTSALIAVVTREDGWLALVNTLQQSPSTSISTMTLLELRIVLSLERFGMPDLPDELLRRFRIDSIDFTLMHSNVAAQAFAKYGRAHHPARLNFGDCAAYATARIADEPLLFVGNDFSQTDVVSALG